jgi:tRNA-specific 2-thiouridylase
MSGGVDSSVAAALLLESGHDVVGVTMKLWGGESDTGCCSVSDVDDARRVAQQLGIEHHVFNFGDEFDEHVVGRYVDDHRAGRTPNPCIECNRHLKFDKLLRRARGLGFDTVATGHHARVVERADGSRRIARGADTAKDQSYVLYMLGQDQLAATVLPLGSRTKADVRAIAASMGLRTASKPESQEVCFITETSRRAGFHAPRVTFTPGRVVDHATGAPVGHVDAVELVTVGQRRGLGLPGGSDPRYVLDVDVASATSPRSRFDGSPPTSGCGPPTSPTARTCASSPPPPVASGSSASGWPSLRPRSSTATVRRSVRSTPSSWSPSASGAGCTWPGAPSRATWWTSIVDARR